MRAVQFMADRLLEIFAPKVTASAAYYWQPVCIRDGNCGFRATKYTCYCHDNGGGCTNCTPTYSCC